MSFVMLQIVDIAFIKSDEQKQNPCHSSYDPYDKSKIYGSSVSVVFCWSWLIRYMRESHWMVCVRIIKNAASGMDEY